MHAEFQRKCMGFALFFYTLIRNKCLQNEILSEDFYFAIILHELYTHVLTIYEFFVVKGSSIYTITSGGATTTSSLNYPYAPPLTADADGMRHLRYPDGPDSKGISTCQIEFEYRWDDFAIF